MRPLYRRLATVAGVAALTALTLLSYPGPGWADDAVSAGSPADGAALTVAPTEVRLTFSAAVEAGVSHLSVRNGAGREVTGSADPRSAGERTLWVPVTAAGPGDYTIAFHVVFTDGSQLTGARYFSFGTGVPPAAHGFADRQAAAAAAVNAHAGHNHDIDPASAVLLVVDLLVAGVVGLLLVLRPRPAAASYRADRLGADPPASSPTRGE